MIFANTLHVQAVIMKNYRSQPKEYKFLHIYRVWHTGKLGCIYDILFKVLEINMNTAKNCDLSPAS